MKLAGILDIVAKTETEISGIQKIPEEDEGKKIRPTVE